MSTQKKQLSLVQSAACHAQSADFTRNALFDLYLSTPDKQREEQFVSTADAARIAGMSQRTIQFWIDSGALPALRIGRNYKVSRDSLREYLHDEMDK